MKHVIINRAERIDDEMEDFRLTALEREKNYTASKIKLVRQPETDKPLLFYTQELTRNFKDPADKFAHQQIIKVFTPSNLTAVSDTALEKKFYDTLLAHKPLIENYNPLSDIHSQNMNLFMDEQTATFMSDVGINIDGFSEDFQSLESVSATPFMEDVAKDAALIKRELRDLQNRFLLIKEEMARHFTQDIDVSRVSDDVFAQALALESVPQAFVQTYLSLKEQIDTLRARLGDVSGIIFSETRSKIKLPSFREKKYDIQDLQF